MIATSECSHEALSASRFEGFLETESPLRLQKSPDLASLLVSWEPRQRINSQLFSAVYNTPGQGNRYDPLRSGLGDSA